MDYITKLLIIIPVFFVAGVIDSIARIHALVRTFRFKGKESVTHY